MSRYETPVRSPTGTAWILTATPFIFGGEILWEALKDQTASFFRVPFSDGELFAFVALCALLSSIGLVWVVSLYAAPGRLVIDPEAGLLRRERRERWRRQVVEQPLEAWKVRVQFFSERYREEGAFRRLELEGPGLHEVLLLNDMPDGKALYLALAAVKDRLGGFALELKRPAGA